MIYKELLKPEIISAPQNKLRLTVPTFHEQKYFISPKKSKQ